MRQETFYEFIKKAKLPFFFVWPLNIVYSIIIVFIIYHGIQSSDGVAVMVSLIITIGFFGIKLFIYSTFYKMYHVGGQAIKELNGKEIEIYENVGIYIKGFDVFDQKKSFPPETNKPIYYFDRADIVLTEGTLILMGKDSSFGGDSFAYPVEITTSNHGLTSLPKARLKNWKQNGNRVEIQIEDSKYNKPINIDFKDRIVELKRWLTEWSMILKV